MQFVVIMWEKKGKKFCKTGDQDFLSIEGNTCKTGKGIHISPT